jgi:chromosome segregation ATPase
MVIFPAYGTTRPSATTRSLQSTETAHKHTIAELQRTRTSLQAIRATHQSELKKKEKEVNRMLEKWSKLSDVQAKLITTPSGMRCANVNIVEGSEVLAKGQGFLEVALEHAEQARNQLGEENTTLRRLVLSAVNEGQSLLHQARCLASGNEEQVSNWHSIEDKCALIRTARPVLADYALSFVFSK